jgi:arsenite-transporting ATPase
MGFDVHLTTSDPAAHLSTTLNGSLKNLQVSRINPHDETERYRQHVLETKGRDLDEAGKRLLEEDLRSPCTEEIAVFQAFSRVIREAGKRFVVMDTAPTGHTLLLLDATGAYHREIAKKMGVKVILLPHDAASGRIEPKFCWLRFLKPHRSWKRQTCRLTLKERGFIRGAGLSITAFPLRIRVLRCFASVLIRNCLRLRLLRISMLTV